MGTPGPRRAVDRAKHEAEHEHRDHALAPGPARSSPGAGAGVGVGVGYVERGEDAAVRGAEHSVEELVARAPDA